MIAKQQPKKGNRVFTGPVVISGPCGLNPAMGTLFGEMLFNRFYREEDMRDPDAQMAYFRERA